jgi:hypothetical protein
MPIYDYHSDIDNPSASGPSPESDGFAPYDIDRFWPDLTPTDRGHIVNTASAQQGTPHPAMPPSPPSTTPDEKARTLQGSFLSAVRQSFAPSVHRQRLGSASPAPSTTSRTSVPDTPIHRWGGNDEVFS